MSLLDIEELRAGYGETQVLRGVDLSIDEGEVVALVGRNGAGKTTTLRSIVGSVTPTAGTVTYDGEDITGRSSTDVAKLGIGLVPEERRVFPGLTVVENLQVASYGGSDSAHRRTVADVMDSFESLDERREARAIDLSGGEQQMLAIARALVAGADCLLLDEPTEGLAPVIVQQVEALIEELHEDDITILLVEQNLAVALAVADRVLILDNGEIVFEGTPDELEANPEIRDQHLGVTA